MDLGRKTPTLFQTIFLYKPVHAFVDTTETPDPADRSATWRSGADRTLRQPRFATASVLVAEIGDLDRV